MYQMKDAFEEALKKRAASSKSPALNIKIELENGEAEEEDKKSGLAPSKIPPKVPAQKLQADEEDPEMMEEELDEDGNPIIVEEDPEAVDNADTLEQLAARAVEGIGARKPTTLGERAAAEFLKKKK